MRIAFVNFWKGFVPKESSIAQYIASAFGSDNVTFVERTEMPNVVVCSVFGPLVMMMPFYEQKNVFKIFYTGENICLRHYQQQYPKAMIQDVFDAYIGFERGPECIRVPFSVFHCQLYDPASLQSQIMKSNLIPSAMESRMKRGCLIARHDHFGSRTPLVYAVQSLGIELDFPSDFMKNVPGIEERGLTKHEFLQTYLFNLCPENSGAPGYITEKLMEAALAGCIPLYWGDAELEPWYNRHRVIYLDDKGLKKLKFLLENENVLRVFYEQPVFVPNAYEQVLKSLEDGKQNINKKCRFQ